jgi:hypothetical protein
LSPKRKPLPGKSCGETAGAVVRALRKPGPEVGPLDPDLALILDRWPDLPAAIRRAVRALVESAGPGD